MKKIICVVLTISFFIFGCAGSKISPNAVSLGVDFSFDKQHKCSSSSPAIKVSNVPAGTKTFKVTLVDIDVPAWNHGGGSVANDGSGVIPEGALTSGYNGPCPPSGSHTYQFTVKAINAEGTIIGIGDKSQRFP